MQTGIDLLKEYLLSEKPEEQKRYIIYRYFEDLFKERFHEERGKADIYIDGQLVVETKSTIFDYLSGFYQALHYKKKGLSFSAISVIAYKFIGLWKIDQIPDFAIKLANYADPQKAPSEMGKINAKKTNKGQSTEILKAAGFLIVPGDFEGIFRKGLTELFAFQKLILNLDAKRLQIDTRNFIDEIELLENFFDRKIDAVHCFYSIIGVWDETAKVHRNANGEIRVISNKGFSESLFIHPHKFEGFKKFIEQRYVFTNEGSGLKPDYYFSRFDEVLARIDPEYTKQHGIFFTDNNLSKFALWFVHNYFEKKLSEKYIVLDPAGGSGNLVTSWKVGLKHKVVSELQPDLLKMIELRMKLDPMQSDTGFTIVPKTRENEGLNFLDQSGEEYFQRLENELGEKNLSFDKPLAFLLNPPYKNTDEKVSLREEAEAEYDIHESIIELTGNDASRERYLAFLGQILTICNHQVQQNNEMKPVVMIFTPTSWLIPRPTYVPFRKMWDQYFKYENGFLVNSKEFFKVAGKWPLAFTIWSYEQKEEGHSNQVKIRDLTEAKHSQLEINWLATHEEINKLLKNLLKQTKAVNLTKGRKDIRLRLPRIKRNHKRIKQPRYDFSHAKKNEDYDRLVSGFPVRDKQRHFKLKRKCGDTNGSYVGFMDDNSPVRLHQDSCVRMSNNPNRIWFRLDLDFKGFNKIKLFNGPADNRSYCAYDIGSAKVLTSWFSIAKSVNGIYPLWANQFDIWTPLIKSDLEKFYYSLCFCFALIENRCVVTKFEANNPVEGAPEVFVDNPLCTSNHEAFWQTTLQAYIDEFLQDKNYLKDQKELVKQAIEAVSDLYSYWNEEYTKGQFMEYVGLHEEAYFKYFNYPDFLTPYSGLIQIRKYAEIHAKTDLLEKFQYISNISKAIKKELYRLLVEEFGYFK
jgi:hypothetical protein